MQTRPLPASFGVELVDVDLGRLDATGVAELTDLVHQHGIVVSRSQDLDDHAHERLARALGEPCVHPIGRLLGREPGVEHIVDDADSRPFQDRWHTDISFLPVPPVIGTLRAIDIPERGGDTVWSDMRAALAALSPPLVERLEGITAWHDAGLGEAFREKAGDELVDRMEKEFPGAEHPVVLTHPRTGDRVLYVNRQFTSHLIGFADDESAVLLDQLAAMAEAPNRQYRHHWRVGDVIVWDERLTQHYAAADHYPRRREMARMTVVPAGL